MQNLRGALGDLLHDLGQRAHVGGGGLGHPDIVMDLETRNGEGILKEEEEILSLAEAAVERSLCVPDALEQPVQARVGVADPYFGRDLLHCA